MLRLKQLLLIFSLCFMEAKLQKLTKQNFTSEWLVVTKDSLYPPLVTRLKDHLVYVSFPLNFSIKLESSKIFNKPCEVPITMIKEHKGKNVTPVYAESLGNGKVVVSLLEYKKGLNQSFVWLYVIDPRQCNYVFNNFVVDTSLALARDVMTIVPYQDTFDIFIKSDKYCKSGSICSLRWSDKTVLVSSTKSVIPYDDEVWDISTIKDYDPNGGYIYIVMMNKSNSTAIKWLNANLETVQTAELNHSGSIAYWYDDEGSASLCFGLSDQEIECVLMSSRSKIQVVTTLYYDSYVQYYSIFRLKRGGAVVLTILSTDPDGSDSATYVQYVAADGEVASPFLFQEFICDNVFEMNTFEVKNGLFCASTMCQSVVNTKCIGPIETREF